MRLDDFLTRLAIGDLSNSSWVDEGTIDTDKLEGVMLFLNEGLTKLFSRFDLKRDSLIVYCSDGKVDYELTPEHQMVLSLKPTRDKYIYYAENFKKYQRFQHKFKKIQGLPKFVLAGSKQIKYTHHFMDFNLVKIISVADGQQSPYKINDYDYREMPNDVFIHTYNTLRVPNARYGQTLLVTFQARPAWLEYANDIKKELPIPEILIPALSAYVAFNVYSNMNTETGVQNAQKYSQIYENIMNEIMLAGDVITRDTSADSKFIVQGWV